MGSKVGLLSLALCGTALSPMSALAQAADQPTEVETIIVTAQKREEALVDVPISITSVSEDTLEKAGVEGILDLAKVAPGLITNRFGIAVQPTIRGVTTRIGENSVATYVDGFYVPSASSLDMDFNNIARVDVLKGPQGTLFGRNATGGAIVITTRNPTHTPTLQATVGIEELGGRQASLYASTGLSEALAADFAASARTSDGWIDDTTGADANRTEHQNYRARLLWTPDDRLSVTATAEYGVVKDPTTAAAFTFFQHRLLPGVTTDNVLSANHLPTNRTHYLAGYVKTAYKFAGLDFTSYTSYRRDDLRLDVDLDSSATAALVNIKWDVEQKTFQQEFNLASNNDGPLTWVVGLFYFNDRYRRDDPPGNVVIAPATNQILVDTEAAAAFADVTYNLTEALSLTAGARYSWERKSGSFRAPLTGPATVFLSGAEEYRNVSPRLIARYEFAPNTNVYASWSRGFKSGTFNTTAAVVSPTDPEKLDAFEVGFKTARRRFSFDAAAYHYDWKDIQVARFDPTIAGGNVIFNAAAGEIYGAEAQANAVVTDDLSVRLGVAYTHGEYVDFPNAVVNLPSDPNNPNSPNTGARSQDWSGTPLIRTPEWTVNLGWDYTIPVGLGDLTLTGNVYYTSKYNPNSSRESVLTGRPDLTTGPYTLVNLSMIWALTENFSATLYARNAFDEKYVLGTDASAFGQWRVFGEPRVVGLKLSYRN